MSFVSQEAVRCPDCDIRGDLHSAGYPLKDAKASIRVCGGCGGSGSLPAPSSVDPYAAPVDPRDPYTAKRLARAQAGRHKFVPRPARRQLFDALRVESLMSEEAYCG